MCRDKSRVDRICEGDSNTRFFHISVTIRRVSNRIMCLKDEVGNENSEPGNIKDHILIFHRKLYSTEQVSCPDLPDPRTSLALTISLVPLMRFALLCFL